MTVPSDNNIPAKEYDKFAKYKDLEIEISMMRHVTETIPVVTGALGRVIKKQSVASLTKFEENLTFKI